MEAFQPTLTLTGQKSFQGGSDGTTVSLYFLAFKTPGLRSEMKVTFPFGSATVAMEEPYDTQTKSPPKVLLTFDDPTSFMTSLTAISDSCRQTLVDNNISLPHVWALPIKGELFTVRAKLQNRTVKAFVESLAIDSRIKGVLKVTCVYSNPTQAGICLELIDCTSV